MPTICNGETLAPASFNFCDPEVRLSEIGRAFWAKANAEPFTDWTQPAEWLSRVDNATETGDDYIRALTVIGDMPAPADTIKDISNGRKFFIRRDNTINLTIDDCSPENHDLIDSLKTGKQVRFWIETMGGLMFGGNDGILATATGVMLLPRGAGETMTYQVTMTWKGIDLLPRCESPIFEQIPTSGGGAPAFDVEIDFTSDATPTHGSNAFTAGATNATMKFRYTDITPVIGTPASMDIEVSAVLKLTVDFTLDFIGRDFEFVDTDGTVYAGVFTNGTVSF